jgi:ribosomal protein L37AE/L43A
MAKSHRGKGLRSQVRHGRGLCPLCKRTAVKVIYDAQVKDKTIKVCKTCKAALSHGKHQQEAEALTSTVAAATPAAPATT